MVPSLKFVAAVIVVVAIFLGHLIAVVDSFEVSLNKI
jgi:hypothetical protein